jgi:O-antigen/teichoic acid export membrane protein
MTSTSGRGAPADPAAPPDDVAAAPATGQTRAVVLGGVASSLAAYAFQIIGARALGDEAYAPVGILWTLQYLVLTIGLLSTEAYVTRRHGVTAGVWGWIVGLAAVVGVGVALAGPDLLRAAPTTGGGAAGAAGGSGAAGAGAGTDPVLWAVVAGAIVLGFGLFVVVRGQLAAGRRYVAYGVMTGGESVVRLAVAAGLLLAGGGPVALAATLPIGGAVLALPWLRTLRRGRVPVDSGRPLPFLVRTTAANGVAQVLLAAGPLAVAALGGSAAAVTIVFVTTTAARAPMVFVHSGALARILPPMQRMAEEGRHADLRRMLAHSTAPVVGGLALVAAAGAAVGPPLVALTFGAGLRPSTPFAALSAVSVGLAMLALVMNQVAIAVDAEHALVLPWAAGLLAAAGGLVLAADLPVDLRVAVASAVGLATAVALVRVRLGLLLRGADPSIPQI